MSQHTSMLLQSWEILPIFARNQAPKATAQCPKRQNLFETHPRRVFGSKPLRNTFTIEHQRVANNPQRRMNTRERTTACNDTTPRWHVVTHRTTHSGRQPAGAALAGIVEKFNRDNNACVELFAPTIITLQGENAATPRRVNRPLLGSYAFLHSTAPQLRELHRQHTGLNPVIDRASSENRRYLAVPDNDMARFRHLATILSHQVPCFSPQEINLEKGDYVGIVGGPFQGIEGTLITQQGSDGGRVAINIANQLLAVTYHLEPRYIKILRFAKGNKHVYDHLDAFARRLDKAIAEHTATGTISLASTAALGYFIDRFGSAEIPGVKTRCRFKAHLMAAAYLLGDTTLCDTARADTLALLPSVTNPATAASIHRLLTLCTPLPTP